jgi:hypothetical protein
MRSATEIAEHCPNQLDRCRYNWLPGPVPENSCTKFVHWQPRHAPCAIEGTASSTTPGCWTGHSARSIDVQERPPEPGSVVAWCLRLSHCGRACQDSAPCRHRRRVHHAAAFEARPSRMPANAITQLVPDERPSPARADDRTLSSRPASVRPPRRSSWWPRVPSPHGGVRDSARALVTRRL